MKCNRIIANIFRKHLAPFQITNSQLSMLFVITKAKAVNQKRLSDQLYLDKSTVNRNLKRLVDAEYVVKETSAYLSTTHKGKILLEAIIPHWDNAMIEAKEALKGEGELALNLLLGNLSI